MFYFASSENKPGPVNVVVTAATDHKASHNHDAVMEGQTLVTTYLKSKRLLLFVWEELTSVILQIINI